MNMKDLVELKNSFKENPIMEMKRFEDKKLNKELVLKYISDEELLEKLNSNDYKLHPVFPTLVSKDGKTVYDIRSNLSLIIKNDNPLSPKRRSCYILGYGMKLISKLVAESWNNLVLNDDVNVHHIDDNKKNDHLENLKILHCIEHAKLHNKVPKKKAHKKKIANLHTLNKIRKNSKEIHNYNIKNVSRPNNIDDKGILDRINSVNFKIHPKYPIIINQNGKHIYDIRNNSKILPAHNKCTIPMYGTFELSLIILEAWENRTLNANEKVGFIKDKCNNLSYKNLIISNI